MRLSVVISTYNRPEMLRLVLAGYAAQTTREFEVVVADDGSGPETAEVVEAAARESGLRIRHVWHEDRGFRKCEVLNRGILAAQSDYLLFTDGDCIPRRDVVEVHLRLAERDRYVAGGYIKLPAHVSARITPQDVRTGAFAELGWLRSAGYRPGRRALRLQRVRPLAALLDALTPTKTRFHGNNSSVWRSALERVNGFDEAMVYGGLDRALGYRLENAGIRGKQARHRAVCLHLHHERPYRTEAGLRANREILRRIRRTRDTRALQGLAERAATEHNGSTQ